MHLLHLDITSDPACLKPVRHAVEAFCQSCGFDDKSTGEIGLVVNEAIANVTRHAYGGATDRPVQLRARYDDNVIEISLRDWGSGHDPSRCPPKKDPMVPGGLGMVCLRQLMDEMRFVPQPDGMLLTMKRKASLT
ncbi:MAG TPA: ATP-binding protein [Tepidisphaeraceae bacterium]|jgi:anti-sigma regulatory factor (Ser/Thr protein kinase)|nr:ATP-binding protein [Tepidisphaeraceae bacterium]